MCILCDFRLSQRLVFSRGVRLGRCAFGRLTGAAFDNRVTFSFVLLDDVIVIGAFDHTHAHDQQDGQRNIDQRSEEHTSELQSLMRISYAVFCLKKKKKKKKKYE